MTQEPINQRFEKFLTTQRISQKLFSEITGINTGTVSDIFKGKTPLPKADFFQAFLMYFPEVNIKWLLIGEGDMLVTKPYPSSKDETATIAEDYGNRHGGELDEVLEQVFQELKAVREEQANLRKVVSDIQDTRTK